MEYRKKKEENRECTRALETTPMIKKLEPPKETATLSSSDDDQFVSIFLFTFLHFFSIFLQLLCFTGKGIIGIRRRTDAEGIETNGNQSNRVSSAAY